MPTIIKPFGGATTSAQLADALSDETGTGAAVFNNSPSLITPALGTPASGTLDNCTSNTEVDNASGTQLATTEFVQTQSSKKSNSKAMSQGINMLAATSGSNGIQVADNNNLDMGTDNLTLHWEGSLPDWTPSTIKILIIKRQGTTPNIVGVELDVDTTGKISVYLSRNTAPLNIMSTASTGLIDGQSAKITAVITRETASTAGSVYFYVNGVQLGSPVSITAAATYNINNTGPFYVAGFTTTRTESNNQSVFFYNRALTAAEVLCLCLNKVNFADKDGSQTELMPNTVDRNFSGASAWANVDLTSYDETGDLTITATVANQYCTCPVASMPTTANKRYRLSLDVANIVSTWTIKSFDGTQTIGTISANGAGQVLEFIASTTGGLRIVANSTTSSGDFDNFSLKQIGTVLRLEPEGIQPGPGQWLDSSSNKLHAMQPAVGSSIVRRKKDFEIRWTNTWAGTHEAQYMGGINQAILPANCYITDIIGVISGATIEDIIIGDGSDVDRWVTITTGLAAGTVAFTIANRISDGTNYTMVVDPDANFTGSIIWTIRGIILES